MRFWIHHSLIPFVTGFDACLWAMCVLVNQSINQFTFLVFTTHHGSQQTIHGKTSYAKHFAAYCMLCQVLSVDSPDESYRQEM